MINENESGQQRGNPRPIRVLTVNDWIPQKGEYPISHVWEFP
jgi:hypothetical protein